MRRLLLLAPLAAIAFAQSSDTPDRRSPTVKINSFVAGGMFQFFISLCTYSEERERMVPEFSGTIVNVTSTAWPSARFTVNVDEPQVSFPIEFKNLAIGKTAFTKSVSQFILGLRDCANTENISIDFSAGESQQALEAAKANARAASARKIAQDNHRAAILAEEQRLSRLPTVGRDTAPVFVGSDKKCTSEFIAAEKMEGLEKRKKIADLLAYGCGFIANPGAHVTPEHRVEDFVFITIENGPQIQKHGWIHSSWLKPPKTQVSSH